MDKIETLINQMTLEEKVSLAAGADWWRTVPIERLNIPSIKVSDGPNGARGESFSGQVTSACFPVGIALAATWNTALIERVGKALAEEAKSKGAVVLLAPTVNIHRHPLNGRNFECYSEDPYLSARIAVAYITGLQNEGVSACIKHFVCNDSEFERMSMSSEASERALREIYLPPFRAAVEAGVWAIMSSYNKINGTSASENSYLLRDILKGEWGFDGLVVSDWFGTYSEKIANGGLDLEMPGPARWMGKTLLEGVQKGEVSEEVLNDKVRRLLRLIERTDSFGKSPKPEAAIDKPEHHALLREVAAESIVLLKNEGAVLPIKQAEKIAIIGTNAVKAFIQGGGSAGVRPHYVVTPYEGISAQAAGQYEIAYEMGYNSYKMRPVMETKWIKTSTGEAGIMGEFFPNTKLQGEPVSQVAYTNMNLLWIDNLPAGVEHNNFSGRFRGKFTAEETGSYQFSLVSAGLSRLFIDGKELINNWENWQRGDSFFAEGSTEVLGEISLQKGQSYDFLLEYSTSGTAIVSAVRIGCLPPLPADLTERAVKLAAESDVAIVFAGLGDEWESEGADRHDIVLPAAQNELIARVAEANPKTIVVLNIGSPVVLPWLNKVAGVLVAWYGGQEMGNAIADVLFGRVNPSGKLSETFPMRLQDTPAYINYPGENGKVHYGEGLFVGYRYYEKKAIETLFPFGYGLSYTNFSYSDLQISGQGTDVQVRLQISNTGQVAGQEVVQLYVRDPQSKLVRPEKELKAFAKVNLAAGESQTVSFNLKHDAFAYYDPAKKAWIAEAGAFEILVGSSSADIRLSGAYELAETTTA